MSGVYIKGMQMPENCAGCSCIEDAFDIRCRISGKIVGGTAEINCFDPRPSDCPLIPVPDHGQLIDADEYRNEFMNAVYDELNDDPDWNRANRIIDAFDSAPTIIPADKEDETR